MRISRSRLIRLINETLAEGNPYEPEEMYPASDDSISEGYYWAYERPGGFDQNTPIRKSTPTVPPTSNEEPHHNSGGRIKINYENLSAIVKELIKDGRNIDDILLRVRIAAAEQP